MNGTFVIVMVLGALFSAFIAASKGRNPAGWLVVGALFPLIGAIAIVCLPAVVPPPAAPVGPEAT